MKRRIFLISLSFLCALITAPMLGHSPHCNHKLPEIAVQWTHNATEQYVAKADYFKTSIFSMFDPEFVREHLLPSGDITSRDGNRTINGQQLNGEIEQTIAEVRQGLQNLTYFTVIKDKEFNWQKFAGLIVLKSKKHPFVVKLFTENPATFLDARAKGTQHSAMSRLSGGSNRYLAGFTRMKNLEAVKAMAKTVELSVALDFPRKWYWLPTNEQTMTISGKHFDDASYTMEVPSVYAIVADWIPTNAPLSYMRHNYRCAILDICKKFDFEIDPNIKNYRLETGTGKLVLIDTEHYRSLLSLNKKIPAESYMTMHVYVAAHALANGLSSARPKMKRIGNEKKSAAN